MKKSDDDDHGRGSGLPPPKVRPDRVGPVHVELISIGRDLLRGRTTDSNSQYLAERITRRGGQVQRVTVVDDDEQAIGTAIREALGRNPHLLVTSGGLGPARDDRTLAAVANVLQRPLTMHTQAKAMVEAAYQDLARARFVPSGGLNLAREKLCRLPIGSEAVPNPRGVAPGCICRLPGGSAILCLPGRPDDMRATLEEALPLLKGVTPHNELAQREIESPTPDEAELRPLLEQLADEFPAVWISSHPSGSRKKGSKIMITVEATAPTKEEANQAVSAAQRRLIALAAGPR